MTTKRSPPTRPPASATGNRNTTSGPTSPPAAPGPPESADLWWIAGVAALAALGIAWAAVYNAAPAPGEPVFPGSPGATFGASGDSGGILTVVGIPTGSPLNVAIAGVFDVLIWLATGAYIRTSVRRVFAAAPNWAFLQTRARRFAFVFSWIFVGAAGGALAYVAGGLVPLGILVVLGLPAYVADTIIVRILGGAPRLAPLIPAYQAVASGLFVFAPLALIFPTVFGPGAH